MNRLVRAELRKLSTTRLWWGLLIGVAVTAAAFAVLTAAIAGLSGADGTPTPGVEDPAVVRSVYTAGLGTAYLFALVIGVVSMAGEYRHQTITATLLGSPRRVRVVLAKLVALSAIGLVYGVVTVLAGVVAGASTIALRGGDLRLTTDGVPRSMGLAVVAVALWAVLGLGVGTLIRNQVLALLLSVGVAWIVEPLLALGLNALDAGTVAKFLPSQATTAIVTPPTSAGGFDAAYLPWWGGVLVLLGYALVSAGVGAALTLRRDVT
ncbi:ABC transporter permease subunit [Kineosporia sp. R_H_3]|uniref:ABC transporter permease subunit n=1 Tax=Kineosporia sp. R_H_3 TaxID=1961848 RepID=UPI00130457C6|nr:ABC transporter permease subunit [Kineosporia sp. R_H_3]